LTKPKEARAALAIQVIDKDEEHII
jgi:hypothetical protein